MAKDSFSVNAMVKNAAGGGTCKGTNTFSCSAKGYAEFINWVGSRLKNGMQAMFVMEATGVYHEELAFFLHQKGYKVCIVLPSQSKQYRKSLNLKTKTDAVDAEALALMGLERSLRPWKPMSPQYIALRRCCRERAAYIKACTAAKNQLHAMEYSHEPDLELMKLKQGQIDSLKESVKAIEKRIKSIVDADSALKDKIGLLTSIPGVALATASSVAAETNGFELFTSISQLVSYAGLDVSRSQSGKHEGKGRISKKGSSRLRQPLFMAGLSAGQHNPALKALKTRIQDKNPNAKNKGHVAVMRKLLALCYTLWTKNEEYDPCYKWGTEKLPGGGEASSPSLGSSEKKREACAPLGR